MAFFSIALDTATPALKTLTDRLQGSGRGGAFMMVLGAVLRKEAMERALAKGGRKMWRQLARSIKLTREGPETVTISSSHVAAAQKQFGGKIRAKGKAAGGADFLTIPISEEARDRRASDFALAGKKLVMHGRVLGYEAATTQRIQGGGTKAVSKGGKTRMQKTKGPAGLKLSFGWHPLFVLVKETREQAPDPWFPSDNEVTAISESEAERFLTK